MGGRNGLLSGEIDSEGMEVGVGLSLVFYGFVMLLWMKETLGFVYGVRLKLSPASYFACHGLEASCILVG